MDQQGLPLLSAERTVFGVTGEGRLPPPVAWIVPSLSIVTVVPSPCKFVEIIPPQEPSALISLTHNLAIEFAPYITVNAIAPGFIGTAKELEGYDEEFLKSEQEKILVGRYGDPKEVAKLVAFLASEDAAYINNTVIRIDGGQYGA